MLNFLTRQFKRFGPAVILIVACVSFLISFVLAILYFYNIPSAVAIRMIPRSIRRGVKEFILAAQNLPYLPYVFSSSKLSTYEITIDQNKLNEIHKALPMEDVALLAEAAKDSKRATVKINGKIYEAKFGIHGDTSPHWLYEKKSWQVKIEGENVPENLREIMFIVPLRRFFITEQFNNYRAKKFGLLVPESKFANLKINGKNQGVYFVSEGWSEDFLRRVGILTPTNLYGERAINEPVFSGVDFWKKYTQNQEQKFDDFGELRRLLDFVRDANEETFRRQIFSLIDEDNFYKWYIHALLSGSTHQDWAHNLRIYFDRESGKLKFIPWDVGAWSSEAYGINNNYNPLISRMITIPEFRKKRDELLYKYVTDPYNLNDDLAAYDKIAREVGLAFYKDPLKEYSNKYYDQEVARYRQIIKGNFDSIKNYLERSELKVEIFTDPAPGVVAVLDLVMTNSVPLKIERVSIAGETIIEDTNRNGRLDSFDRSISKDKLLYSRLAPTNPNFSAYAPFVFVPEKYRFFVVPAGAIIADFKVEISANNVITGKAATVEQQFFSGIPLEEIHY